MTLKKVDISPTDSKGYPIIDPTANVLQLVEAANLRQDDLRKADSRRLEDLRIAETKRVDEVAELRSSHIKELAAAEAKRIDAIRAVDVAAVATASERASQQASVLANQVSTSAETLRTLVASTAAAQASSQAQFSAQITERLALLEKSQYKGEGRSGISDPALAELIAEVKNLRSVGERTVGKSAGIGWVGAVVVAAVGLLVGLFAIGGRLLG